MKKVAKDGSALRRGAGSGLGLRIGSLGAVGAVVLTGCGGQGGSGEPETPEGEPIVNASEFLADASAEWEDSLSGQNLERSDDPACYFVLNEEEQVTGDLACGGTRSATGAEGEVWTVGEFEIRENSAEEMNASLQDGWLFRASSGATRPAGGVVDAEGEAAPESIDAIAAAPLPQVASGVSFSGESVPTDLVQPSDETTSPGSLGTVVTPAGTLVFNSVAVLETVPVAEGVEDGDILLDSGGEDHAPADGEEFMVLDYEFTAAGQSESGDEYSAALAVNAGGQQQTLAEHESVSGFWGDDSSPVSDRVLLSVSDDDPHLIVSSAGVDQRVDLPSGERVESDETNAYYRDVTEQDVNHEFSIPDQTVSVDDEDLELSVYLSLRSASLTAHTSVGGGEGWAEPDMAWVLLEFDTVMEVERWGPRVLDAAPEVVVTADGEEYSSSQTIDVDATAWNSEYWAAVQVPADAVDLSVAQAIDVRVEQRNDIATVSFAADSYELSFPQEDAGESE